MLVCNVKCVDRAVCWLWDVLTWCGRGWCVGMGDAVTGWGMLLWKEGRA